MSEKIQPGVNPSVVQVHFSKEEKIILEKFGREFYITHGGHEFKLGMKSRYRFFLLKPTNLYQELFNIEKEIIVIFSDYENFEPRTLDSFDYVIEELQNYRVEKICTVLISRDIDIEEKINNLIKTEPEYQVIIPFTYEELLDQYDSYFLRNRFRKYFYSRDLFSFSSPLKKEIYFFGRSELIHKIASRHRSNENSGLFGLRKTGKTSIIYGIQRNLELNSDLSIYVDCQNTSFHLRKWNLSLKYIIDRLISKYDLSIKSDDTMFKEEDASLSFEKLLKKISELNNNRKIMIIFDEVEHITPGVSLTEHWKNGNDFILFWQTLRSIFQANMHLFSYLIVGTNPKSIEMPTINGIDNPIYSQIPYQYIEPFSVSDTRSMVRKLGRTMGLKFDEEIYSKLTEDFGGHPFLIRNVCSVINNIAIDEQFDRPIRIDKTIYEKGKKLFNQMHSDYYDMIMSVLKDYYPHEYDMLTSLAIGNYEEFIKYARESHIYTNHLLGYHIIDKNQDQYFFKIESLREYLIERNKYKKLHLSNEQMLSEISERRNRIEKRLRNIVRQSLLSMYGKSQAQEKVVSKMQSSKKERCKGLNYKDIFNPNLCELYFSDLIKIINSEWGNIFKHIFSYNSNDFNTYTDAINKYRNDAHAKDITKEEFEFVRICFTKIENMIDDYD